MAEYVASLPTLSIFLAGKPVNVKNERAGWRKRSRLAKTLRERTAEQARVLVLMAPKADWATFFAARKRVTFTLQTLRPWDDDALAVSVAPCRDAMGDASIINAHRGIDTRGRAYVIPFDHPDAGHEFIYQQRIDRQHPGVWITVEARVVEEEVLDDKVSHGAVCE